MQIIFKRTPIVSHSNLKCSTFKLVTASFLKLLQDGGCEDYKIETAIEYTMLCNLEPWAYC